MSNNQAETVIILGFLLFVFGLLALPTANRWMILNYCSEMNIPVEQCVILLEE